MSLTVRETERALQMENKVKETQPDTVRQRERRRTNRRTRTMK